MSELFGLVPPWLQVALLVVWAFFMGRWSARRNDRDRSSARPPFDTSRSRDTAMPGASEGRGAGIDAPGRAGANIDMALETEVRALMRDNRKIEAIKRVREMTGMGLKEAKDAVEALERQYGQRGC